MNIPSNVLDDDQPLLDFSQILSVFLRRKWTILASILGAIALALAYLSMTPPVYTAKAVMLLDPRGMKTTGDDVISNIGSDSAAIASQVTVIASSAALQKVFDGEQLVNDEEYSRPGLIAMLLNAFRDQGEEVDRVAAAFDTFRKSVYVDREGLTYVLNVNVSSEDPHKAARIANRIVDNYITDQVSEKSAASDDVSSRLNSRIERLREAVATSEKAVESFRIDNNIFELAAGRTLVNTQIEQLSSQWLQAQIAEREAANKYNQAAALGTSPEGIARLTELMSSRSLDDLRRTYSLRVSSLARSNASLGSRHPTRLGLEAEVTYLANLMRKEAERILSELRSAKTLAHTNAKAIRGQLDELRRQSDRSNQLSVQLRELERNSETSRKVLEQFMSRAKETGQLSQLQRADARVISAAVPPSRPVWPRPLLTLLVAALLGLLLGSALALMQPSPADAEVHGLPRHHAHALSRLGAHANRNHWA